MSIASRFGISTSLRMLSEFTLASITRSSTLCVSASCRSVSRSIRSSKFIPITSSVALGCSCGEKILEDFVRNHDSTAGEAEATVIRFHHPGREMPFEGGAVAEPVGRVRLDAFGETKADEELFFDRVGMSGFAANRLTSL